MREKLQRISANEKAQNNDLNTAQNGGWHAEPVEGAWKYIQPKDVGAIKSIEMPFATAEYKPHETEDKGIPQEPAQEAEAHNDVSSDRDVHAGRESGESTSGRVVHRARTPEQILQDRWNAASDAQRREMSKAFEYYVHLLMYRGMRFHAHQVTDLMLDADQYKRFKPSTVKEPSYWLAQVRALGATQADLTRFQQILSKNKSSD